MKRLILRTTLFLGLVGIAFFGMLALADGTTDPYYLRFATPRAQNLIIGTSRAAQGIVPQVLEEELELPFFNYAFTLAQSPYGDVYNRSIRRKAMPARDGQYILAVDPWSLCSYTVAPDDTAHFREVGLTLDKQQRVTGRPNYEYLLRELQGQYYKVLTEKVMQRLSANRMALHTDGWLEVTVPMDSASVAGRTAEKLAQYRAQLGDYRFSPKRMEALLQLIDWLQAKGGQVHLVRLPTHPDMLALEAELMPDFATQIASAKRLADSYTDLTPLSASLQYTDGNHLHKASARQVSAMLSEVVATQIGK